ncbi:YncE family protein [Phaeovulum sp. W22_SRMD_FR3]|uniref:YncE family protein n=1 Tax=Phaeovulum sp. W22_SRMD_FR3 TaxID=3240274 RepID=UPI003F9C3A55
MTRIPPLALAALTLLLSHLPATAQGVFAEPTDMAGRFRVSSATPGTPIFPGTEVLMEGTGFAPGQQLTLQRGTSILPGAEALVADADGNLSYRFTLPADAALGVHPVVALGAAPSVTALVDLKVSPDVPLTGEEMVTVTQVKSPAPGLYQIAYSARSAALFVTTASFRPAASALLKLDPATLKVIGQTTPPAFPEALRNPAPGAAEAAGAATADDPVAVFGIGLDETRGQIWVTNTAQNSVAVYRQSDLSLVKQFPEGQVYHAREVLIDAARGLAYVTSSATAKVHVFDAVTLEPQEVIEIPSTIRGSDFYVMNLAQDTAGGRIFVSSRATSEVAVIDAETRKVVRVFALPGTIHATGIAFDSTSGHLLVTGQDSDNLMILDPDTDTVLHDVDTGAGALSVKAAAGMVWVVNRGAGTLTGVDAGGQIRANLRIGSFPNDLTTDGAGTVFVVNKSLSAEDPQGDLITKVTLK